MLITDVKTKKLMAFSRGTMEKAIKSLQIAKKKNVVEHPFIDEGGGQTIDLECRDD